MQCVLQSRTVLSSWTNPKYESESCNIIKIQSFEVLDNGINRS